MVDKQGIYDDFVSGSLTITLDEEQSKQLREALQLDEREAEFDFIKSAIEKQIPKKVIKKEVLKDNSIRPPEIILQMGECPVCKNSVITPCDFYCRFCGQALDWSDE